MAAAQGSASPRAIRLGWVAGLVAVALAAALILPRPGSRLAHDGSYILQSLAEVFATVAAFTAVRRLRGRQKLAWAAVGVAYLGQAVPMVAGAVITVALRLPQSDADGFAIVQFATLPAAAVGAVAIISAYMGRSRLRTVFDALIASGAVYIVAWLLFLRVATERAQDPTLNVDLIHLAADLAYCMIIAVLLVRAHPRDRLPLALFVCGILSDAVAALLPTVVAGFDNTMVGQPLDVVAVAAIWATAMASLHIRQVTVVLPVGSRTPLFSLSTVPYVAVVIAGLAVGEAALHGDFDTPVVVTAVLMMVMLSVRQYLALRENERLADVLEQSAEMLRSSEERFRGLVQNSSDVITVLDSELVITYVAPAVTQVLGGEAESLTGTSFIELIHPDDRNDSRLRLHTVRDIAGQSQTLRFRMQAGSGGWRTVEATTTNLLDHDAIRGLVLNTRDVTDRQRLEDQLRHQAFHDPLSGLANRALFQDRLEHAMTRLGRSGGNVAVVLVDLDDFKTLNDSLGHAAGDEILTSVATRLAGAVRDGDTAARLGGDEFAILLENDVDDASVIAVAERALAAVARSIQIAGRQVRVRGSAGIALGDRSSTAGDVLRHAEVAMYHAKARTGGKLVVFEPEMEQIAQERMRLHQELQLALDRGELFLQYQPVVRIDDESFEGVEALVRWRHPERGLVPPGDFIAAAEETDLIVPLSRWVLRTACAQVSEWRRTFGSRAPLSMAVNISARHLQTAGFVDDVLDAVRNAGVDARSLILELTESALVADLHGCIRRLQAVKQLGVRIALDDFGTGYSSFSYLRDLPVDIVKIDRSFIIGLGSDSDSAQLVRAIQTLSRSLRLTTIAEGVEEPIQVAALRRLRVDQAQGFHFARPVDADAVAGMVQSRTRRRPAAEGGAA